MSNNRVKINERAITIKDENTGESITVKTYMGVQDIKPILEGVRQRTFLIPMTITPTAFWYFKDKGLRDGQIKRITRKVNRDAQAEMQEEIAGQIAENDLAGVR